MRIGAKSRPFYRVVAVDERRKRTGAYLELLGTYNPLTEPKEIILKKERINYWMEHGAVPSDGYLRIIGKAPQKPPRKPKKAQEKKAESAVAQEPAKEAQESEAETPSEEPKKEEV
ncbi:MAG: 30S ribosomal protein S16 [Candidatus Daviesbacteria bacterium GW2011_GWA1_41_61]|uniref:30S ribosomal protein S16 n=1 Tax=Candidatus Daviesbacteria bacterium GW2011_GWA2_40_9 TaxID=1618424 RepID=A0A0G0U419_9BACT|nr:MAG: ribosomal protein S16, small subunit ribosomal protein S16 [Candidatus Daviesbacteria bacterium GW2011_GWC1_40_9]KKR83838.1 MAG: 30S ribosomal protein S16 [Candidatus Daviesbacteria bacterium GW2011_GWA2_40_9]KKR93447.1 MAG: 30S ribosomal protein S16 [Candidatus Daviesbacteria bacterium GW2011_GWB1_41_15]KKS15004.1 MAG: 30S ribosomal protein S16 [Candidatus Daviesbacteria bacterium GW2011_GWA1_41_61]